MHIQVDQLTGKTAPFPIAQATFQMASQSLSPSPRSQKVAKKPPGNNKGWGHKTVDMSSTYRHLEWHLDVFLNW